MPPRIPATIADTQEARDYAAEQKRLQAEAEKQPSNNPEYIRLVREGGTSSAANPDKYMSENHPTVPKHLAVASRRGEGREGQLPIEIQQQLTYEQSLTTLAEYQNEEQKRFDTLRAEAIARDEVRTREYQTLMSDFSTKLTDAENKRTTQYTSFMSQLTKSFTDAENVRKQEKKALNEQLKAERDLQTKTELEKKTLLESSTAQQIQRLRLKGSGVRKPTIKTSNVGLAMTGLLSRPQAIGM